MTRIRAWRLSSRAAGRLTAVAAIVFMVVAIGSWTAGAADSGPQLNAEQEKVAQKIFRELVSPCCWTTTVDVHGSGRAPEIQAQVREFVHRGMGYQKIIDFYVAQYGERILAKPKKEGFNLAAYWVPYIALIAGGVGVFLVVRKGRERKLARASSVAPSATAPAPSPPGTAPSGSDEEYQRRLEAELKSKI